MNTLRTLMTVFILHLKQVAVDSFVIFTVIIQPLLVALLAIFMLRGRANFEAIYVIVGSGLTGLWSGTLFFSAFNINFERWVGTLEEIVGSPTSLQIVVSGKSLANSVMSVSSMFLGYTLATLLFGFQLTIRYPALFAVSLVLGVLGLIATGLLIAPFMAMNLGTHAWVNAMEFPMYILGGFLFTILLLPGWTTPISYALAPYWAARALHASSSGQAPLGDIYLSWTVLVSLSLVYLVVSRWMFRKLLFKARVDATLGLQ